MTGRNVMVWFLGGVLIGASGMASADAGETEVRRWLDIMARAVETLDYRGTMVYLRNDQVDTLRIVHRADADGVRERIYSLDGQPREILRNRDEVKCLFPDDQSVIVQSQLASRLLPSLPLDRLTDPDSVYGFVTVGKDRVAGMNTRVVEIQPRDAFRYGHRLWLEWNTGMLLRSALLGEDGRILQQLMFTDIELGARIDDRELEPQVDASTVSTSLAPLPHTRRQFQPKPSWQPSRVPSGFRLTAVERGEGQDDEVFEHLLFSDGLASFSIYLESHNPESASSLSGLEAVGPVHVYSRVTEDMRITVVGEVPAATVQEIGRQLRRMPGGFNTH